MMYLYCFSLCLFRIFFIFSSKSFSRQDDLDTCIALVDDLLLVVDDLALVHDLLMLL